MTEFQQMIVDHATGAKSYSAVQLAKAGIASGLSPTIRVWLFNDTTPTSAYEVLGWLLCSTDFAPEPAMGDKFYRVAHSQGMNFVQAGDWLDAFICIRYRKMIDRAPSLARLVESCQELEPIQRNLLLSAPTCERFPLTELDGVFEVGYTPGVVSAYDGTSPVNLSFTFKDMASYILSFAFRLTETSEGLVLEDGENRYKFNLVTIPPAILAAMAWRELHLPA